jgi:hypothetical protein
MKKLQSLTMILAVAGVIASCNAPMSITATKDPNNKSQISKVVVMPLFESVKYIKQFEPPMVAYFNSQGLKSIGSMQFLNPEVNYTVDAIKHKCDSLGADAILLIIYEGSANSPSYIPPVNYYSGGYGDYGGYWGGGYWGAGYFGTTVTTGGTWTTSSIVYLTGKLYTKGSKDPLWTGEVDVNNPKYIDEASAMVAGAIFSDWKKQGLINKNP